LSSQLLSLLLPLLLLLPLSLSPLNDPLPFVFFLLFTVKGLALDVAWASCSESGGHAVQFHLLCGGQTVRVMSLERFRIGGERLEVREEFLSKRIHLLFNLIFHDSKK
jgi:hypothetical protein